MTSVTTYFKGERFRLYTGAIISVISITTAFFFQLFIKSQFSIGMAYPFLIISSVELIAFMTLIWNASTDLERVNNFIQFQPEMLRIEEFPRIKRRMRVRSRIKIFVVFLIVSSCTLFLTAKIDSQFMGAGAGIMVQAILLYAIDFYSIKGSLNYWNFLQSTYRSHQRKLGFDCFT